MRDLDRSLERQLAGMRHHEAMRAFAGGLLACIALLFFVGVLFS